MNEKKRTYKGNVNFKDFIRETIQESIEQEEIKARSGWRRGVPGADWNPKNHPEWMTAREHIIGDLWAIPGWDKYHGGTGAFRNCRPLPKIGAKLNVRAFETINFEMV